MSYEYSENELVQNSAIELLRDTLGWRTFYAYNDEVLDDDSSPKSIGRSSYKEILLIRYLKEAVFKFNDWMTDELFEKVQCVNRFVVGQLILHDPVISLIRRELRKMADGIMVESEEVENILRMGVLKRDVVDEEDSEAQKAMQRVAKFYRQAAKKCEKKVVEQVSKPNDGVVLLQETKKTVEGEQLGQEILQ